jgi:hypothetical protein
MAAIYSNGVTAGIFLASILLKEMRYLVYIRYLCHSLSEIKFPLSIYVIPYIPMKSLEIIENSFEENETF